MHTPDRRLRDVKRCLAHQTRRYHKSCQRSEHKKNAFRCFQCFLPILRAEKLGFDVARSSSIHRTGRIYRAHLVTLSFAFVLGSFFLSELPGIRNLLDHYLMNPWAAIGGSLVLLFRPPLMDILPMYVLFSFLTPAAFGAALLRNKACG